MEKMVRNLLISFLYIFLIYVELSSCVDVREGEYFEQRQTAIVVSGEAETNEPKPEKNCDRFKCFNALQCELNENRELFYYVYPPLTYLDTSDNLLYSSESMFTQEYWKILSTILSSSRITLDPNKACYFVPSIDLSWLNEANPSFLLSLFENLPYWRFVDGRPGTNHIIISIDPSQNLTSLSAAIGNAILVSNKHNSWTFRGDLDLNTGVITHTEPSTTNDNIQAKRWDIAFTQYSSLDERQKESINKLKHELGENFLVSGYECSRNDLCRPQNETKLEIFDKTTCRCTDADEQWEFKFPSLLESSRYCLILNPRSEMNLPPLGDMGHYLLAQALRQGCVPIISVDLILPYHSQVKWSEITVPVTNIFKLKGVANLIGSIDSNTYERMSIRARQAWLDHFRTYDQLANSVMIHYDTFVYPKILSSSRCAPSGADETNG